MLLLISDGASCVRCRLMYSVRKRSSSTAVCAVNLNVYIRFSEDLTCMFFQIMVYSILYVNMQLLSLSVEEGSIVEGIRLGCHVCTYLEARKDMLGIRK